MPPKSETAGERVVNKKQLTALIVESKATKERVSSITGSFGERVKNAVENGHLDKKAFGIVSGLYKMNDELRRKEAIRNTRLYLDMCEEENLFGSEHLGDIAEQAQRAAEEAKAQAEQDAQEHVESNVVALKGISQLEEDQDEAVEAGAAASSGKRKRGDALASLAAETAH